MKSRYTNITRLECKDVVKVEDRKKDKDARKYMGCVLR